MPCVVRRASRRHAMRRKPEKTRQDESSSVASTVLLHILYLVPGISEAMARAIDEGEPKKKKTRREKSRSVAFTASTAVEIIPWCLIRARTRTVSQ